MLLYLSGNTCPDIAFTVNCCVQYMFCPKRSHEFVLKILVRYLKHTQDRCLVLDPNFNIFKVDVYPDSYFEVMYGKKILMIRHVPRVALALLLRLLVVLICGFPDFKLNLLFYNGSRDNLSCSFLSRPVSYYRYYSISGKSGWPSIRGYIN